MHLFARIAAAAALLVAGALPAAAQSGPRGGEGPLVAAASDLKFALEEIASLYERRTGAKVRLAFGSSGNFARQIAQGGPFEMFLSADESYVEALAAQGHALGAGDLYAVGRLVLFVPDGAAIAPDAGLRDLAAAAADGRLRRLAIANPEHAPYGRAAREALQRAGLGEPVRPRLVLGENVSQAAQFATTGAADAGLFAYSLALSPAVAARGRYVLLPEDMHAPLRQRMVLLKRAGPAARQFYAFVQQPEARAVLARHGFAVPQPDQ